MASNDPNPVAKYWKDKRGNTINKMGFDLTLSDIYFLLYMARITIKDVGRSGYHLARFNDTGPYTRGNCRFVPVAVNIAERKTVSWNTGKKMTPGFSEKCRQRQLGKIPSATTRARMGAGQRAIPKASCILCKTVLASNHMDRHVGSRRCQQGKKSKRRVA